MSRKSYIPNRLREAVRYKVKMVRQHRLGRKAIDTARAWLDRDYTGIPSGYCFMADDGTLPLYWYVPDGDGWYRLVRGQCIITIDFRTLRILGFSLQPDKNYSAPVIHTLHSRVFTDHGVPALMYWERGIWESSKILTGGIKAKRVHKNWQHMPLSPEETSRGFGDLGIRFVHAYRARSKPVERVFGLVQDMMEREPGYCGRDERRDCPHVTKSQMDDVKFHRRHPKDYFYDQAQWTARLEEIFNRYNATPQEGKILAGLAPDDAQEKFQDPARAPMNFDLCRHLLAHYKIAVTVGSHSRDNDRSNGITIRLSNKAYVYRNERTGQDKFQRKLAWWNPEEPSILAVTDLNMRNPYSVPLSKSVNALVDFSDDPTDRETYEEQTALIEAHESAGKTLYRTLRTKYAPLFRRVIPDRATLETGVAIQQQRETIVAERKQAARRAGRVSRNARENGLDPAIMDTGEDGEQGSKMMRDARRENQRQTQPPTQGPE